MSTRGNFGLSEEEIAVRLDFLQFTSEDAKRVRAVRGLLEEHTEEVADDLYAHIQTLLPLREILDGHLTQCKLKQSAYLRELLNAEIDRSYTVSRAWVGDIHRQLGVEPRWYLSACSHLLELLTDRLLAQPELRDDPARALATCRSLTKLVFFDVVLALDAYADTLQQSQLDRERDLSERAAPMALEVWPGIVVVPVLGSLDTTRALPFEGTLLQAVASGRVQAAVMDIGRLPALDLDTGRELLRLAQIGLSCGLDMVIAGVGERMRRDLEAQGPLPEGLSLVTRLADAVKAAAGRLERG